MAEIARFLPETETKVPIIHPPGDGKSVGVLGSQSVFKVLSEETGGAYAVLEQNIPPQHGPPLHMHHHETEIFYILKGQFEITVGNEVISAPEGTIATCPRNIPHTFKNVGSSPGKILLTVIPGRFSNYFIDVDNIPDKNHATIQALCAKYGVDILDWRD